MKAFHKEILGAALVGIEGKGHNIAFGVFIYYLAITEVIEIVKRF
jgi:hypothetical protein